MARLGKLGDRPNRGLAYREGVQRRPQPAETGDPLTEIPRSGACHLLDRAVEAELAAGPAVNMMICELRQGWWRWIGRARALNEGIGGIRRQDFVQRQGLSGREFHNEIAIGPDMIARR